MPIVFNILYLGLDFDTALKRRCRHRKAKP